MADATGSERSTLARFVRVLALVLGLAMAGILATAWIADDNSNIPFDYDGFD